MDNCRGFSLIELLVAVVIVGILSAIAIPNIAAARRAANEASAIASLKIFLTANHTYFTVNNTFTSPLMLYLPPTKLIDDSFGRPEKNTSTMGGYDTLFLKSGYAFIMVPTRVEACINDPKCPDPRVLEYFMVAIPETRIFGGTFQSGVRRFYTDSITNQPWVITNAANDAVCFPDYKGCIPLK